MKHPQFRQKIPKAKHAPQARSHWKKSSVQLGDRLLESASPPSTVGAFKTCHISYAAVNDVHGSLFFSPQTPMDLFERGKEKIGFHSNKKLPEKNCHMIRLVVLFTHFNITTAFRRQKIHRSPLHLCFATSCRLRCAAKDLRPEGLKGEDFGQIHRIWSGTSRL